MEKEIRIADFFTVIKRRLWVIVLASVLAAASSGAYSSYSAASWTPLYQSSARILVNFHPDIFKTLSVIVKDPAVLDKVSEQLQLGKSASALSQQIFFRVENESQIVRITAEDPNPEIAAQIANTTAAVFTREIGSILGIYDTKLISEAKADQNPLPTNSEPSSKILLGIAVGLVLGIGIVLLLDSLDQTLRTEHEVEKIMDLPVLGAVSKMNRKNIAQKMLKRSSKNTLAKGGGGVAFKNQKAPDKLQQSALPDR
ncbi:YveK family protein [Ammoniphilus sp. YIM 78166]|uniref:YveK family protein n=1 Tax=Ammoniphilus sp. YIM 78166 TaxID=1644106 RepID=UPI0014319576|nr:lipopolysaccharide biosynthesis protein [Ammoniphilus sp. YIM 78166]